MMGGRLLFLLFVTRLINCAGDSRCEAMRIPWCLGAYDSVVFPNFFGHKSQEDAYYAMHKVWPLIQSGCSDDIANYLCRLYAPQCPYLVRGRGAEYVSYYQAEQAKPPCEEACLRVKKDCQRVMNEQGLEWPEELECHRLRNKDCHGRPTVEVKPTQMPYKDIDWSVETIAVFTPTRRWRPVTKPSTTTTTSTWLTTSTGVESVPEKTPVENTFDQEAGKRRSGAHAVTDGSTVAAEPTPSLKAVGGRIFDTASTSTEAITSYHHDAAEEPQSTASVPETTSPITHDTEAPGSATSGYSTADTSTIGYSTPEIPPLVFRTDYSVQSTSSSAADTAPIAITDEGTLGEVAKGDSNMGSLLESVPAIENGEEVSEESDPEAEPLSSESSAERVGPMGESSDEIRFRPSYEPSTSTCEPLTIPTCHNLGYNMTNIDEETQNLAAIQLFYFSPLLEVKCSDHLQGFLCAAYAPPCKVHEGQNVLPPCRQICESARNDCAELMEKVGYRWPEELECSRYPNEKCVPGLTQVEDYEEEELLPLHDTAPFPQSTDTELDEGPIMTGPEAAVTNDSVKCQPLAVPLCQELNTYNTTQVPNIFSHSDQSMAGMELIQYQPLIDVQCGTDIRLFLCTAYLPPCLDEPKSESSIILPCRSLCKSVKTGCAPLLGIFGFHWPNELDCDRFPDDRESNTCIKGTKPDDQDDRLVTQFSRSKSRIDHSRARLRAFEALKETAPLNPSCEQLSSSSICHGLYEMTHLPTLFHHTTQAEATLELVQYKSIIDSKCSEYMKPFLCSIYAPVCTVLDHALPPCKEVCIEARQGCESTMHSYGFRWPSHFNCSQFPDMESGQLCINNIQEDNDGEFTTAVSTVTPPLSVATGAIMQRSVDMDRSESDHVIDVKQLDKDASLSKGAAWTGRHLVHVLLIIPLIVVSVQF